MHIKITESNWFTTLYVCTHTHTHARDLYNTSSQIQSKSMKMNTENQAAALMDCLTIQSINSLLLYAYLCTKHFDIQCNDAKQM